MPSVVYNSASAVGCALVRAGTWLVAKGQNPSYRSELTRLRLSAGEPFAVLKVDDDLADDITEALRHARQHRAS